MLTDLELDWLQNGLRIDRNLAVNPGRNATSAYRADVNHRYQLTQWCYDHKDTADEFTGIHAIWWQWMVTHARLQMMLRGQGGERITEKEFRTRCAEARGERDLARAEVVG